MPDSVLPTALDAGRVSSREAALAAAARRLDRLRLKLFLAVAGANAVLAVAAYLVFSWSFDQGVVESLMRRDLARLDTFAAALAEDYGERQTWDGVVPGAERWVEMSRAALGLSPVPRRQGGRPRPDDLREPPPTVDSRLLLLDAGKRLLFGRPEMAPEAQLKPIVWRDSTVGWLGYVPRIGLAQSFERAYSAQQRWQFAAVALGMLAAALVLGAALAHWLTRRIRTIASGTAGLIRGDYDRRIDARGHDEIAQLARDVNTLAQTLDANRRARQQWVADIAHELRTPLSVLRGEIEALQDGVRPFDAASLSSLSHEAARLARLVEDLHVLSQSDLGSLSYRRERIDFGELLEEVVESHRRVLEDRRIGVDLDVEPGCVLLADGARLAQVLGNLMQNTLRYTDGPGKLGIRLRRKRGNVYLEWQDSSPGVPDEDLPRLTDRLYRVESSRSRAEGGAGLGLAIARAIVEAHGGAMAPGHSPLGGLEWNISFPAAG